MYAPSELCAVETDRSQVVITALILLLASSGASRLPLLAFLAILGLSLFALFSPLLPSSLIQLLFAATIPLTLSAKLPQIIANYRQSSTGQLSAFLVFNSLAGCLARVYTTLMETGDRVIFWSFVGAAAFNGILALQMAYYWQGKEDKVRLTEGRKREDPIVQVVRPAEKVEVKVDKIVEKRPMSPPVAPKKYVRKLD